MIDIYHSRRTYNIGCLYWKQEKGVSDRPERGNVPTGVFYARMESGRHSASAQALNTFQTEMDSITLRTPDRVSLSPNDIVEARGERWIVVSSQKTYERDNEFRKGEMSTIIYLRRGR